jgi:hypothetical protein
LGFISGKYFFSTALSHDSLIFASLILRPTKPTSVGQPKMLKKKKQSVLCRSDQGSLRIDGSRFRLSSMAVLVMVSLLPLGGGCGTLENGRGWGQDAFNGIDFDRVARAARDALLDPYTLVPLAGAGAFAIDDFDKKVSDWAVDHNPIFGTENRAADASATLKQVLGVEAYATAVATPSGDDPEEWLASKAKGVGVELAAVYATESATTWLKHETGRMRPDGSNTGSMPSGHASTATSFMALSNRNLSHIDAVADVRPLLVAGNTLLDAGVGWARVEAGVHYPSDVLVGMALGNFLTVFIHDGLMNLPKKESNVRFTVFPAERGVGFAAALRF